MSKALPGGSAAKGAAGGAVGSIAGAGEKRFGGVVTNAVRRASTVQPLSGMSEFDESEVGFKVRVLA